MNYFSIGKSEIASISTARCGGPGARLDIAATAITRGESYRQLRRRMEKIAADLVTMQSDAAPLLRRGDGNMIAPPFMVFDELFLDREERDRINIYSTLWEPRAPAGYCCHRHNPW
ncbi:hypothetical protein D0638_08315 [Lacticaseibacillus paracasei]|nr:hypothetical protein D0638_08315 [Lacticaseibacillus paracasei]